MKTGLWESKKSVVLLGEAVECRTLDGESPVAESITSLCSDPSSMGHVESRVNQQGPPCKAKYSWVTDSEVVPRESVLCVDTTANELLLWVSNPQNFLDNPSISFLIVSFTLAAFITIPLTGFLKI